MEPTTAPAHNVTIYSTATCTYCKAAKEFFHEKNVAYTEVNLSDYPERIGEMIEKSGQKGVPVIVIDNKVTVGFDQDEIEENLGMKA